MRRKKVVPRQTSAGKHSVRRLLVRGRHLRDVPRRTCAGAGPTYGAPCNPGPLVSPGRPVPAREPQGTPCNHGRNNPRRKADKGEAARSARPAATRVSHNVPEWGPRPSKGHRYAAVLAIERIGERGQLAARK